jgi:hypothetical protein
MKTEFHHYELQCDALSVAQIVRPQLLPTNHQRCTDEESFCDWIASASAGETTEYHCGYLICDRSGSNGVYGAKEQQLISAMARRAWIGAEFGLLHLYSERLGEFMYRYMAVRSNTTLGLTQ